MSVPGGLNAGLVANQNTYDGSFDSILLHGDGADGGTVFTDSSSYNATLTKTGTVVTSTTAPKFGTASILINNTSYLAVPHNARFSFGTGDFCIDFWFKTPLVGTYHVPLSKGSAADTYQIYFTNTGAFYVLQNGANIVSIATVGTISANTWTHIEWSRTGTIMYVFLNGVSKYGTSGATNAGTMNGGTGELRIGRDGGGTSYFPDGRIDEFRMQKGIGGHTANFTPPTAPYGA